VGVGLRFPHHRQVLDTTPSVSWFEVHNENFFGGGTARQTLLIERNADGIQVRSLAPSAWQFTRRRVSGVPLYIAFGQLPQPREHINALLADHLAAGRFIDFSSTGVSPS
jgi:hypothetical protein